jgi:hypothetical protein
MFVNRHTNDGTSVNGQCCIKQQNEQTRHTLCRTVSTHSNICGYTKQHTEKTMTRTVVVSIKESHNMKYRPIKKLFCLTQDATRSAKQTMESPEEGQSINLRQHKHNRLSGFWIYQNQFRSNTQQRTLKLSSQLHYHPLSVLCYSIL